MRGYLLLRSSLTATTVFLLAVIATPASAQIFKKLGDRAKEAVERKAEQKVAQKIDEATSKLVDRSFNSVFGEDKGTGGGGGGSGSRGGGSRIFSMLPNAPTEARYDFNSVVTYDIETLPKGKSSGEILEMTMQFNSGKSYAGSRLVQKDKPGEGAFNMIFDVPNESMVMLFESDTGKFSMAYSWKEARRYAESQPQSSPPSGGVATTQVRSDARPLQYTKLGARRIAGYDTEGYRAEDSEGIADVWVANDPSLNYGRMVGATSSMKGMRGAMPDAYPVGMLMASETTDKKSGDRTRMTVTSVNTKANVQIDMSKYPKLGASK
ncbi:MAG TPA: DUF4412 domain-containing protein [Gemmatimonas sp.]|nr:DUF4412 domain-containing protein [Gemmatimonas sp.]